jgi:hypothetical protein
MALGEKARLALSSVGGAVFGMAVSWVVNCTLVEISLNTFFSMVGTREDLQRSAPPTLVRRSQSPGPLRPRGRLATLHKLPPTSCACTVYANDSWAHARPCAVPVHCLRFPRCRRPPSSLRCCAGSHHICNPRPPLLLFTRTLTLPHTHLPSSIPPFSTSGCCSSSSVPSSCGASA